MTTFQLQLSIKTSGCEQFCRIEEVKRGSSSGIRLWWSLQVKVEVAKKSGKRHPLKTVYGIICALKRYLEEKNGSEALSPLDASDKRVIDNF